MSNQIAHVPFGTMRVVEAEGEHERYRWKREGMRYVIRAGTGTRVLFRVWRERSAIILCTELLCAYNDGYFVRSKQAKSEAKP